MSENNKTVRSEETEDNTTVRARAQVKRSAARKHSGKRAILNVFDVIVILLILLIVVLLTVGIRFGDIFSSDEGDRVRLTYSVLLTDVDETLAGTIKVGDEVRDVDTGALLGTVRLAPVIQPYKVLGLEQTTSADGETSTVPVMKPVPGRVSVTVALAVDASYLSGSGYAAQGRDIRIGDVYTLRFPGYVGSAVCSSIDGAVTIKH